MAIENVTRLDDNSTRATLLCGKPGCTEVATYIVEFEWNGWSGILGACREHHEDLGVMALKAKGAAGEPDQDVPRD